MGKVHAYFDESDQSAICYNNLIYFFFKKKKNRKNNDFMVSDKVLQGWQRGINTSISLVPHFQLK